MNWEALLYSAVIAALFVGLMVLIGGLIVGLAMVLSPGMFALSILGITFLIIMAGAYSNLKND